MKKKSLNLNKENKIYNNILEELWTIRNPHGFFDEASFKELKEKVNKQARKEKSAKRFNVKLPSKKAYFELTTSRNRHLINIDEQNILRKTVVAFFGLSVGSHAALTWMMESRADSIKIADPDTISATNLNRLRFGWEEVGRKKIDVVSEQLLEINPYATIASTVDTSISSGERFFDLEPKLNVVVDAIDDMNGKIYLRKFAKKRKLPLISAADVGDNVVLDIERYDLTPQPQLFLGRIPNIESIDFSKLTDKQRKKLIIQLVGFEENSETMLDSLFAIGGSITSWPQLGATATIAGGVITTAIKKVILGENVTSGRYYISLDTVMVSDFNSNMRRSLRNKKIQNINEVLSKI